MPVRKTYVDLASGAEASLGAEGSEELSKARLARITDRELRRIHTLQFWGWDGMLLWFIGTTSSTFAFYASICGAILILHHYGIKLNEDILGLEPGYRPFLMQALQFLAAFLVGVGLTDAVTRYKAAMSALTDLSDSVENLRMVLLSSTEDPKFRVAVQVHISWMIVLLRKKIAFFAEDFEQPIGTLIPHAFGDSVLFQPEVLWAFDRAQAEFVFHSFLANAKLLDKEGLVKKGSDEMIRCWKMIASLLMVRSPTTRHVLGRTCVELFLIGIPLFNEDIVTLIVLPFVAAVLVAISHLSTEIAEPWGEDFHDLPMDDILYFLSVPSWFGKDQQVAPECVAWLNRGMSDNDWTWKGDSPVPREKRRGSSKGVVINFEDYRTLAEIDGHETFQELLSSHGRDMNEAEARGRRMPKYLRWR